MSITVENSTDLSEMTCGNQGSRGENSATRNGGARSAIGIGQKREQKQVDPSSVDHLVDLQAGWLADWSVGWSQEWIDQKNNQCNVDCHFVN